MNSPPRPGSIPASSPGRETLYLAVDTEHGAAYGNTLSWSANDKPKLPVRQLKVLVDLDNDKFNRMFIGLMRAPIQPARKDVAAALLRRGAFA